MRNLLAKIIHRKIKRSINNINSEDFALLFNQLFFIKGLPSRCIFHDGEYQIVGDRKKIHFSHKSRGYTYYRDGLRARSERLSSEYLLSHIDFNYGDVIIDCGANLGDLKIFFECAGIEVKYIAVEPSLQEYNCLVKNVKPSECLNIALWHESGELDFYLASETADSSLIRSPESIEKVTVAAATLDATFVDVQRIKLLKLEAEGAEPEVLKGGAEILARTEYVTADVGPERGLEQQSTEEEVTAILKNNGYNIVARGADRHVILFKNSAI